MTIGKIEVTPPVAGGGYWRARIRIPDTWHQAGDVDEDGHEIVMGFGPGPEEAIEQAYAAVGRAYLNVGLLSEEPSPAAAPLPNLNLLRIMAEARAVLTRTQAAVHTASGQGDAPLMRRLSSEGIEEAIGVLLGKSGLSSTPSGPTKAAIPSEIWAALIRFADAYHYTKVSDPQDEGQLGASTADRLCELLAPYMAAKLFADTCMILMDTWMPPDSLSNSLLVAAKLYKEATQK